MLGASNKPMDFEFYQQNNQTNKHVCEGIYLRELVWVCLSVVHEVNLAVSGADTNALDWVGRCGEG